MNVKALLPQILGFIRHYLYRGWLKYVIRRTNIGTYVAKLYWLIFIRYLSYLGCSVNETQAKFKVDTLREYKRVSELGDEEPIISDILGHIQNEDVFYDIGANIGLYSNLVGPKVSEGQIIAFEPHPENVKKLKENLAINEINGQVIPYALSDTKTTMPFDLGTCQPGVGKSSLIDNESSNRGPKIQVQTISGDTLVTRGEIPSPTVVKIDVEGAEYKVLRGLSKTLSDHTCRLVYCEIHHDRLPEFGSDPEEIFKLLNKLGFKVSTLYQRGSTSFIRAKKDGESQN